ncbi:MAG: TetR/AcrR family transcriptional regulator [Polyangiales bacterium]
MAAPRKRSTRPSTRQQTKEQTRARLIEAGLRLFAERGLDGPSLDAICERAGFTRGAFYVHFRDRDDFLVHAIGEAGGALIERLVGDDTRDLPTATARLMTAIADGSYPLVPGGGVPFHLLVDACMRSPKLRARYVELIAESVERLRGLLRRGKKDGLVSDAIDARATATLLMATLLGVQTMLELGAPIELPKLISATLALVGRAR